MTSAHLSQFVAEFYLHGILIFEFQRAPFSNNLLMDRLPFKYGRYRTEYDSTVVNGYARGTHVD